MKNIIILTIVAIAISFSSAIAAEKLDISEEAVKATIALGTTNMFFHKHEAHTDKLDNVKIVEKSVANTRFGVVKFYVLTAEATVEGYHFHFIIRVYTGEKENGQKMYESRYNVAASTNASQMMQYKEKLAQYKKDVQEKTALALIGTKLALL